MLKLIDARVQHERFPQTFSVPPLDRIARIKAGDFVKIGAEFEADTDGRTGERFWVVILSAFDRALSAFDRAGSACFRGKIDNELLCTDSHGLSEGDEIEFNPRHILALD